MSVLSDALEFLRDFGLFDIILPFLLVFAVVFGILEKTKILGTEKVGDHEYSRKNLNAIVSFVLGLLVVAATKIVGVINQALPRISLLVVVSLSFILSIGLFMKPGDTIYDKLGGRWLTFLMIGMFIAVVLIFLSVIPANANQSWLDYGFEFVKEFWSGTLISSIILFAIIIWAIMYITSPKSESENKGKGKD